MEKRKEGRSSTKITFKAYCQGVLPDRLVMGLVRPRAIRLGSWSAATTGSSAEKGASGHRRRGTFKDPRLEGDLKGRQVEGGVANFTEQKENEDVSL